MLDAHAIENIAIVAHEANRAYYMTLGDNSQPPWKDAPDWQKDSAISDVDSIEGGVVTGPEDSHKSWLRKKRGRRLDMGRRKESTRKNSSVYASIR